MADSRNKVVTDVVTNYLESLNLDNLPEPFEIESDLLSLLSSEFAIRNASVDKGEKWAIYKALPPFVIGMVLMYIYRIIKIVATDEDNSVIAVYQTSGPDEGTYSASDGAIRNLARQFNESITTHEINDLLLYLKDKLPVGNRCLDKNLVAVNNGIYDYKNDKLLSFTPDLIFLSKSRVNYNPQAKNVIIHNDTDNSDWDVESWMLDLTEDKDLTNLLWQCLGAVIRPIVPWGKSLWLYSETGNNGKGTYCELARNICGEGNHASIAITDFSKDFMLESLITASAIITDENDVGDLVDRAAALKTVVTNDVLQINRKFKQPVSFRFYGFMIQCVNEMPRVRDRSNSFYRRQIFFPMRKSFTGFERKYIKDDYLRRQDVLEYVLYKLLHEMPKYYELDVPEVLAEALNEYKEYNDPIRTFKVDVFDNIVWDFIPYQFAYDLYCEYYTRNFGGQRLGKNTFIQQMKFLVNECKDYYYTGTKDKVRIGTRMSKPEPLIAEYNLNAWKNPMYKGNDIDKMCMPVVMETGRGFIRIGSEGTSEN